MIISPIALAEQGYIPDFLIRTAIRRNCKARLQMRNRRVPSEPDRTIAQFAELLRQDPVALATEEANEQHYEVPTEFFTTVLGPRRKYSCCWFESPRDSLALAEEAMLQKTVERAEVQDGMQLLDLGCGWGSLTLYLAEKFPNASILAISNSRTQREYILKQCAERRFGNVEVQTQDMRQFSTERKFDRILSIEMFEHLRNYEIVFGRLRNWLKAEGRVFLHIFTHKELAYTFETEGEDNWMGRHFFTGGIMPSRDLFDQFSRDLQIVNRWDVPGQHYALTSEAWLANLDNHRGELLPLFEKHPSGDSPATVLQRWRIFFMACAELFGYRQGNEWGVTHYLLQPHSS